MNNDIKTVLTREAFEHTINESRFFPAELNFDKTLSPSGREEYVNSHIESNWQGFNIAIALLEAAVLSANAGKVDADQENNDGGGAFNPDWLGRRNGWNDALDSAIEILHQLNDQSEVGDYFDMAIASIISLKSSTAQQAIDAGRQG